MPLRRARPEETVVCRQRRWVDHRRSLRLESRRIRCPRSIQPQKLHHRASENGAIRRIARLLRRRSRRRRRWCWEGGVPDAPREREREREMRPERRGRCKRKKQESARKGTHRSAYAEFNACICTAFPPLESGTSLNRALSGPGLSSPQLSTVPRSA